MKDTKLYKEDSIGLRTLDEEGKMFLVSIDAEHLYMHDSDITGTFIPFLFKKNWKPNTVVSNNET